MTPATAIQRAEQWRKEGACGEAAKVAIALLNELERVQASSAIPEGHVVVPKEPTEAMLRPFYKCPPEELRLGYMAMLMVSSDAAPANKEGA